MATIATLIVDVVANTANLFGPLDKDTQRLEQSLNRMSSSMTKVGAGLTAAVTVPIVGVGAASLKMAMDAVESENLFEVSFKEMAGAARAWSEETSAALGLNQFELRRTSATLFTMLDSMGIAKEGAFAMATGMTELAHDMASFFNLKPEEAFEKLRAGIVGEAEPLKRLGILVDENTVKTAAYKHGIAAQGAELTQQQKVLARYAAIMDQTKNAQGDLARTLDSPTNQLRRMREQVTEAATAFGMALLPAAQQVIAVVSTYLVPAIQAAVQIFANLPAPVQTGVIVLAAFAAALGPLLLALGYVLSTTSTLLPILRTLGLAHAATAMAATAQAGATAAAGTAAATAAPQVTVLGTALRWASTGAAVFGAAVGGWAIGKWIANLKLFGESAMSIGESFEFGATKLFNWIRGMEVADEDIERAIVSRRKLAETTTALGTTEQDVAAAMETATLAAQEEAAAVTAGAAAAKAAERDAAKLRQTMNELGEAYMEADAAQLAFEQSARQLHSNLLMFAPAVRDNAAALGAYDLIAINSVETAGRHAQAIREENAELARKGILLDFTAHTANNASQTIEAATGFWTSFGGTIRGLLQNTAKTMGEWQEALTGKLTRLFGGGGVMETIVGTGLNAVFGPATGLIASLVSKGMAAMGELVWSGLQKVGGFFKQLFGGPSAAEQEGRTIAGRFRDELAETLSETQKLEVQAARNAGQNEHWASTVIVLRDRYLALGLTEQEALADADRLWRAEQEGGDAVARVIEDINRKTRGLAATTQATTAIAVRGFAEAKTALDLFHVEVGDDVAWKRFEQLLNDAVAAGVTDFEFFFRLLDEWKQRAATPITIPIHYTLGGVPFHGLGTDAKAVGEQQQFAGMNESAQIERIAQFLEDNPGDVHRLTSALGVSPERATALGFQHGTAGRFLDFGAGTDIRVHGRERIMTEAEGRSEARSMDAVVAEVRALRRALRDDLFLAVRDGTAHRRAA